MEQAPGVRVQVCPGRSCRSPTTTIVTITVEWSTVTATLTNDDHTLPAAKPLLQHADSDRYTPTRDSAVPLAAPFSRLLNDLPT